MSNPGWITVTSGASGTGNGTVGYSVAANGGSGERQGTVTIAGQTFTVTQAGTSGGAGPSVNTGQVWQMKDWITGEEVTYSYDELGRLAAAQTTGPEWGQSFGYDGFGDLVSQTVTKGTAPALSVLADPATNRVVGGSYDANGNPLGGGYSYDVENRLVSAGGEQYAYDGNNRRVWKRRRMGEEEYRLGSVRWRRNLDTGATAQFDYWRYGQEKPSATAQEGEKFGTYYRDATGLDYADQRYYSSTSGRFLTADRFVTATALRSPTRGWNRYAYVEGDPVNLFDPSGLLYAFPDDNLEQGAGICSSPLGSITTYGPEGPSSNIVFNPVAGFRGDSGGVGGGQAGAPQSLTPTEAMKKALENLQGPWQRCLDRFLTDARFDWTKFQNQARDIKWLDSRGKRGALSITHLGKRTTRAALAGDSYAVVVAEAAEGTPIRLCWDTYGTLSSATHRRSPIPSTRPCTSSSHSPNRRMTRG